jgi:predicted dehydrogenase
MSDQQKSYVQVGMGGRARMYTDAILGQMVRFSRLVGICDNNPGRLNYANDWIAKEYKMEKVPQYLDTQFDRMIKEQHPDVVIVTTKDCFHDRYIVRAMELGCDVITEKPMTIDEKKCQHIVDVVRRTGRKVAVTFNYRYSPPRTQVKEILMSGAIGRILSVDFQWLLDTSHGADYFRRWHREKKNSGGLMVHKATHHFDLVNWWLSANPVEVYAMGTRGFYGTTSGMVEKYRLQGHAERCLLCRYRKNRKCPFAFNLSGNQLYLANEKYDGYFRDRCVFGKTMDIEDTMNVVVRYDTGAFMSYSLNAFMPWEGYKIAFNGTKGRLEHDCVESVNLIGTEKTPGLMIPTGTRIRFYPHFKPARDIPVKTARGGHGGGDAPMLVDLFSPNPPRDPCLRAADYRGGAMSILVGIAANRSMQTGKPVRIDSLVQRIPKPDLTKMKE